MKKLGNGESPERKKTIDERIAEFDAELEKMQLREHELSKRFNCASLEEETEKVFHPGGDDEAPLVVIENVMGAADIEDPSSAMPDIVQAGDILVAESEGEIANISEKREEPEMGKTHIGDVAEIAENEERMDDTQSCDGIVLDDYIHFDDNSVKNVSMRNLNYADAAAENPSAKNVSTDESPSPVDNFVKEIPFTCEEKLYNDMFSENDIGCSNAALGTEEGLKEDWKMFFAAGMICAFAIVGVFSMFGIGRGKR